MVDNSFRKAKIRENIFSERGLKQSLLKLCLPLEDSLVLPQKRPARLLMMTQDPCTCPFPTSQVKKGTLVVPTPWPPWSGALLATSVCCPGQPPFPGIPRCPVAAQEDPHSPSWTQYYHQPHPCISSKVFHKRLMLESWWSVVSVVIVVGSQLSRAVAGVLPLVRSASEAGRESSANANGRESAAGPGGHASRASQ